MFAKTQDTVYLPLIWQAESAEISDEDADDFQDVSGGIQLECRLVLSFCFNILESLRFLVQEHLCRCATINERQVYCQ